ncbi:hypothetical protein CRUP_016556 [Coryphaenoides rupestris]|nr:hypothetical protein CRUP_016556 [Coryphaenoides rupestris]
MEDFYPNKNHGPDSGIGSDNGEKRLSTTEPSDDDTMSLHSQVSETARADALLLLSKMDSCKDQDLYDFIEPNQEDSALSEGEGQHMSCIKELEKVLSMSQQAKDKDNWKDESGSDKEPLAEEDEDELKEVLDLRKIAVQLLQQEQQNRFLSHSGSSSSKPRPPPQAMRSASLDEGTSGVSELSGQPSSSSSFDGSLKSEPSDTKWPEIPPLLNQNEERRRNKYLRKDYLKYMCQSTRKSSSGGSDDCEDGLRHADFSTALTVFGLKPRSAFTRSSRQEVTPNDPSFTMRRKMEHLREELEQIGLLRQNIESRLKVFLPDDVGIALMDGVVLCHLANHISPRSVPSIHVPSPAVDQLCLPHHILEERGLVKVGMTVQALLDLPTSLTPQPGDA